MENGPNKIQKKNKLFRRDPSVHPPDEIFNLKAFIVELDETRTKLGRNSPEITRNRRGSGSTWISAISICPSFQFSSSIMARWGKIEKEIVLIRLANNMSPHEIAEELKTQGYDRTTSAIEKIFRDLKKDANNKRKTAKKKEALSQLMKRSAIWRSSSTSPAKETKGMPSQSSVTHNY